MRRRGPFYYVTLENGYAYIPMDLVGRPRPFFLDDEVRRDRQPPPPFSHIWENPLRPPEDPVEASRMRIVRIAFLAAQTSHGFRYQWRIGGDALTPSDDGRRIPPDRVLNTRAPWPEPGPNDTFHRFRTLWMEKDPSHLEEALTLVESAGPDDRLAAAYAVLLSLEALGRLDVISAWEAHARATGSLAVPSGLDDDDVRFVPVMVPPHRKEADAAVLADLLRWRVRMHRGASVYDALAGVPSDTLGLMAELAMRSAGERHPDSTDLALYLVEHRHEIPAQVTSRTCHLAGMAITRVYSGERALALFLASASPERQAGAGRMAALERASDALTYACNILLQSRGPGRVVHLRRDAIAEITRRVPLVREEFTALEGPGIPMVSASQHVMNMGYWRLLSERRLRKELEEDLVHVVDSGYHAESTGRALVMHCGLLISMNRFTEARALLTEIRDDGRGGNEARSWVPHLERRLQGRGARPPPAMD